MATWGKKLWWTGVGVTVIMWMMSTRGPGPRVAKAPSPPSPNEKASVFYRTHKNEVAGQLTLTIDSVDKSGVGAVTIVDLTVTNPSYMEIMDPTVTCTSYASNGTEIDHKGKTLYGILKGKRRFRVNLSILHPQPHSTSCGVTDFDLAM